MRSLHVTRIRSAAVALLATAAIVLSWLPALAVQTTTYKLAATGNRTKIVHGYGDGAVHDAFVVADLTNAPITLALDVVGATKQTNGDFALGPPGSGFADRVRLPETSVTLKAHEVRRLAVTIDRPRHTDRPLDAAITAMATQQPSNGIGVHTRLALLVEVAPHPEQVSNASTTSVERILAVVVAAGLAAGLLALIARRRRKDEQA